MTALRYSALEWRVGISGEDIVGFVMSGLDVQIICGYRDFGGVWMGGRS
jgi:hypothetical protein